MENYRPEYLKIAVRLNFEGRDVVLAMVLPCTCHDEFQRYALLLAEQQCIDQKCIHTTKPTSLLNNCKLTSKSKGIVQ
jgi:hypothetical protein